MEIRTDSVETPVAALPDSLTPLLAVDADRWGTTATRGDDAYFTFGAGPRVCIGRQIALTEAQFALVHVLQQYDVETVLDSLSFQPGGTLRPDGPVDARVTRRAEADG